MNERLSLDGAWRFCRADEPRWREGQVPGSVYADLIRLGEMPDPYWRENAETSLEPMRHDWVYRRTFDLPAEFLRAPRVILRMEGIDTLAQVRLNGQPVGRADNMHVTWEWDVRELLRLGENELCVRLESPVNAALAAHERMPGWGSSDAIPGFQQVRKAHCMYGWDWGPRLPDAGIWRSVSLLALDSPRLTGVRVRQEHSAEGVTLSIAPETDLPCTGGWTARLVHPDGKVQTLTSWTPGEASLKVENPRLWWPHGAGDQPLYTLRVLLASGDSHTLRIGLRTVELVREKDAWGESFCFAVNGVRIFAMGADYIPEDCILSRVTPERTRQLIADCAAANMNMIRVWGGGGYPSEAFYDACDELGILVWQDLMYACAFYTLTPEMEKSVRVETRQQVRRLRHRASLALICGNNEIEGFMRHAIVSQVQGNLKAFGPKNNGHYVDYLRLFDQILPEIVREEAPQTAWWPASPSSGGRFDNPDDPDRGDVHYWDVWHGQKPFTDYRRHFFRFVSEFGFQSFPLLPSVEQFTAPGDRNIFSPVMERHQRNGAANGKILAYLSETYRYPTDFGTLLWCSQLLQADAIRCGVEHWRRNRGRCMGAIYWQLNDCWPVASWASIDYYGRWKALHYQARRFFAPVLLSCEEEGQLSQNPHINEWHPEPIRCGARLNVSNERREPFRGEVRWQLRDPAGRVLREGAEPVEVPALSAVWLEPLPFPEANPRAAVLTFSLWNGGSRVSGGSCLFCAPKHFAFEDPRLEVVRAGSELIVRAQAYAQHVWLESEDPDLRLSDNDFDLVPGEEKRVRILRGTAEAPRARSVWEIGGRA